MVPPAGVYTSGRERGAREAEDGLDRDRDDELRAPTGANPPSGEVRHVENVSATPESGVRFVGPGCGPGPLWLLLLGVAEHTTMDVVSIPRKKLGRETPRRALAAPGGACLRAGLVLLADHVFQCLNAYCDPELEGVVATDPVSTHAGCYSGAALRGKLGSCRGYERAAYRVPRAS